MLYQRYFLRMNQSNMTHVLALLLALILALSCTFIVSTALRISRNNERATAQSQSQSLPTNFQDLNGTGGTTALTAAAAVGDIGAKSSIPPLPLGRQNQRIYHQHQLELQLEQQQDKDEQHFYSRRRRSARLQVDFINKFHVRRKQSNDDVKLGLLAPKISENLAFQRKFSHRQTALHTDTVTSTTTTASKSSAEVTIEAKINRSHTHSKRVDSHNDNSDEIQSSSYGRQAYKQKGPSQTKFHASRDNQQWRAHLRLVSTTHVE